MDSPETLATFLRFSLTFCLVPNVASVSGLSIHHCPLRFSLTLYILLPVLPVSLDCLFIIALYAVEGNDEWTVQRHWRHWEQDIER
jgi:hypothetical protein